MLSVARRRNEILRKFLSIVIITGSFFILVEGANAQLLQTWTGAGTAGQWDDANNWDNGGSLADGDTAFIPNALTATITSNVGNFTPSVLIVESGAILDVNQSGGTLSTTDSIVVVGILTLTAGDLNAGSNSITGTGTLNSGSNTVSCGTISISNLVCSGSGQINISGNWSVPLNGFTRGTSTVTFNGTGSQLITTSTNSSNGRFYILNINNTGGSVTAQQSVRTANDLILDSGDYSTGNTLHTIGGNFDMNGGTFSCGSSVIALFGASFDQGTGLQSDFDAGTSTWEFDADVDYNITTSSALSFDNLTHRPSTDNAAKLGFGSAQTYTINTQFIRGGKSVSVTVNTSGSLVYLTASLKYIATANATIDGEWPTLNGPGLVEINTNNTITNNTTGRSTNNLLITGGGIFLNSISGSITINTQLTMTNGTFSNIAGTSGLNYSAGATLLYNGSSAQVVGDEWTTDDSPTNLTVSNSFGPGIALNLGSTSRSLPSNGNLRLLDGLVDFSAGSQLLTINGNVIGGGGEFGTSSLNTLIATGAASSVTSSASTTIYNLIMNTTGGFLSQITINNLLTISTGNLATLNNAITLANGASITIDGTMDLNSNSISKTGTPTINLNGTLHTGGSSMSGFNWVFGGSSTVIFDGSSQESIAGSYSFRNITINNVSGVTVGSFMPTVAGTCSLAAGKLITTSGLITVNTITTIGDGSTYVQGPLAISSATGVKLFPIGKENYRPVTTNLTSGGTPTIRFEVFDSAPNYLFDGDLVHISLVRYWLGTITGAITGGTINLTYGSDDGVQTTSSLRVAHSVNNGADAYSPIGETGSGTPSGNITGTLPGTALGYFTLGTTVNDNSLPVELSSFAAKVSFKEVTLTWTTQSELENEGFNLYRRVAGSGLDWAAVNQAMITGRGNTSESTNYEFTDRAAVAGNKYEYMLESISHSGIRVQEKIIEVDVPVPSEFALLGNYPNPFNPITNIKFQLPEKSQVSLKIYDIRGNLVAEPALNTSFAAGEHNLEWNATDRSGRNVASGMYIYLFRAGNFEKTGRMILLK